MAEGSLQVGAVVNDTYEVTRLIGRGGMGEVWLASHRRLPGKQVALKVLHTNGHALPVEAVTRFRREAEVVARIGHPNIVEVHDFNTLPSGEPYLVLEFLQGESLASRLRHGPLPLEEAIAVVRQAGSALDKSHSLGVVHRDLKPDNIFLVQSPLGLQVKVLDFGISKIVDSTTVKTMDAVLVGTPQYMSPEQALGNNREVGPQTDVFALGSIAYEMLSGRPPFVADSIAQVVFKIAYEPHVPLAHVVPSVPATVAAAVEKALTKDLKQRYQDIAQFVADFSGAPVTRPPPSAPSGGVARPGESTDSLMLANTAAPTPGVATPQGAAAAVSTAQVKPDKKSPTAMVATVGVIAVAAVAAVLAVRSATPSSSPNNTAPMPPAKAAIEPPPQPQVAVLAPPAAVQEVEPTSPELTPAPRVQVSPPPAPAPRAAPAATKRVPLSADEQAQLAEVAGLVTSAPERALVRADQLRRGASDALAAALDVEAAKAACAGKEPDRVLSYYDRVTLAADRRAVRAFCARHLPNLSLQ